MRFGKRTFLLSLFVVMFASLVIAQGSPQLPHMFYGTAKVDGADLIAGSTIIAKVAGSEKGRITTTSAGKYGGPSGSDDKLLVQGNIADNAVIGFFVSRVKANEAANFDSGKVENKNLTWTFPDAIKIDGPVFNEPMTCMSGTVIDVDIEELHLHITCTAPSVATLKNISKMSSPPVSPGGLIRTTDAFEISVSGSGLSIIAILNYDEAGVDEDSISPFKYGNSWSLLPFSDILGRNKATNNLTFKISAGTPYALFGSPSLPPAPANITNASVVVSPDNPVSLNVSGMLVNITSNDSAVAVINNLSNLGGGFVVGTPTPGGFVNTSSTFEISISGNVSIIVTIPYNDAGIDESTITIFKFVGGVWTPIPSSDIISIDTVANMITFKVSPGGTPYTSFGSPPAPPGPAPSSLGGGTPPGPTPPAPTPPTPTPTTTPPGPTPPAPTPPTPTPTTTPPGPTPPAPTPPLGITGAVTGFVTQNPMATGAIVVAVIAAIYLGWRLYKRRKK